MTATLVSRTAPGLFDAWQRLGAPQRLAIRLLLGLIMVAVVVVTASTSAYGAILPQAPVGGSVDRMVVDGWSDDASNYLVTYRWSPISFAPSGFLGLGSIAAHGTFTIQQILIAFAVFLVRVFMMIVNLTSGADLVNSTADTIDSVFAKIGNGVLGNDGGSLFSGQGAITISTLTLVLLGLAGWRFVRGGVRAASGTLFGGLAALALLMVMSGAAATNVKAQGSAGASAVNPAIASPSWFITKGSDLSAWVGDRTQEVFSAMTDSLDQKPESSRDECERYIEALHYQFKDKSRQSTASNVIVSFDDLMVAVLWNNVRVSAMGGANNSSDAAWCRYSEMDANVPMVDQVQVSRVAGLYSDIVGYSSAVAMHPKSSSGSVTPSTVTNAGEWKTDGQEIASEIFGPTFVSGEDASRAKYFWAACQWDTVGSPVKLNPAWSKVNASSAANNTWYESFKENLSIIPVLSVAQSLLDIFSGDDGHPGKLTAQMCANVVAQGLVNDDNNDAGRAFQYGESYSVVDVLMPWNISGKDFFKDALAEGDTEAYNFYLSTQALNGNSALVGSLAAVVSTGLFLRFSAPVAVGLLAAQVVGIIAWMLLPIVLLLLIVPTQRTKMLASMAARTVVFSLFAAVVFQFVLQFAQFAYTLTATVIVPPDDNSPMKWGLMTLSAILGFVIVRYVAKAIFSNDITSMRGALKASTQIANRPLMSQRGVAEDRMGFNRPSWVGRATSQAVGAAINDGARRAKAGVASKVGGSAEDRIFGGKKATEEAAKKATGAAATAVGAGTDAAAKTGANWKAAAVAAGGAGTALGAGAKPLGSQVRGQYATDPAKGTFTIPKDGTISAAGAFPSESALLAGSKSQDEYAKMTPQDRKAYMFDPVSGRFISKMAASGLASQSLSKSVVAPLSAAMDAKAPEGVSQADWDKTAQMRAAIASTGPLAKMTPERKSLFDEVAATARERAAATGHPLPDAPSNAELARQGIGVQSAAADTASALALSRHANGQVKEGRFEGRTDGLREVGYREDGTVARKVYERDGARVSRAFAADGSVSEEQWTNAAGKAHRDGGPAITKTTADGGREMRWMSDGQLGRIDGPAVEKRDASGAVTGREFHLGGSRLTADAHAAAVKAAGAAVSAAGVGASGAIDVSALSAAVDEAMKSEALTAAMALPKSGLDQSAVAAAVALSAQAAVSSAMVAQRAAHVGSASLTRDQSEGVLSALESMDPAALEEIAQQAARAVMDDPALFASVTNSTPERVSSAAEQMVAGGVSSAAAARMIRLVNENGQSEAVQSMREMMADAAQRNSLVADGSFDVDEQIASMVYLNAAQQRVMMEEAARTVLAESGRFASARHIPADDLIERAQSVLDGSADMSTGESMLSMVRDSNLNSPEAVRVRAMMESASSSDGAMSAITGDVEAAVAHVAGLAQKYKSERVTAIQQRMARELEIAKEQADRDIEAIASSLVSSISDAQPTATMDEGAFAAHIAGMQREAYVRKVQVEEALASQMGQSLDGVGVELLNASVASEDLDPLRNFRQGTLSGFQRVKAVRSWFRH